MSKFAVHVARWRGDVLRCGLALGVVLLVAAPISHAQRGAASPAAAKAAPAFVNPVSRLAIKSALGAAQAAAAVTCPNAIPVVDENNCHGAGSSDWMMSNYDETVGGYATKSSFNRTEAIPLKIGRNVAANTTRVDIAVFRMGYYGGEGGRQVLTASNVLVNNTLACNATDPITGKYDCGNWQVTYTIAANALPASGVYLAKLTTTDAAHLENTVVFVVRDDNRNPKSNVLVIIPTATYQAYNNWGGKSLYFDKNGGPDTVSGTGRAVKVSFNRPQDNAEDMNRFVGGPDIDLVAWLEQQGYDLSYIDDYQASLNAAELKAHKAIVISGHSEYWSLEEFNNVKAARDAGVNVASFSANTAYWKVRYEDGGRTLVCYKTVQGDGSGGSGSVSANDWGPDGIKGTADDALGLDGIAGTADDRPQNSTTTFRDNGAPNGDPNAPPGGRVGPDLPENQLFGVMYVGDNDSTSFPLTIPAANGSNEFAGDRIWRNTGISINTATDVGTELVGWEWDAIPTQAQYASREPAGVKRLTETNVQVATDNSWILDEGRQRANIPPPGQPGTVNAVKYTAASGALVFATGTMQWAYGLGRDADPRIQQAVYNVFSDMGVQPATPVGVTVDPTGNKAPTASFTFTPNPAKPNQATQFNASSSTDTDGTIVKYEWDFDGNGTYETTTTSPTISKTFTSEQTVDVHLRVTDNGGATDFTTRTVQVIGNQPPTAAMTAAPNPVVVGQTVTFNGSGSADPDGTITKYEWDLDGNGTFETNTGTTKTATKSYATVGQVSVKLRVTDNGGKTATATVAVTVSAGGVSAYPDAVLDTTGLADYWRLGDAAGASAFADSKGSHPGTASNVTFGVTGGVAGDPNTAARFDGASSSGQIALDLSQASQITVEFWLKWNAYANDDSLAMEFTPNFNSNSGGFLVDPSSPQQGGKFGVAIGNGSARNNVFFNRPSAGIWHHYALVIDTTAAAANEITPYVDGAAVAYTKADSGSGAGAFANSTLYLMSRAGASLFGAGDLDELAVYTAALPAATIQEHYNSFGTNRRPISAFTISPSPAKLNQTVTFNASSSTDPDGSIVKYEWDLDGNGTYEVSSTSPSVTKTYATEQSIAIHLRVTDNLTGTDTTTKTLFVGNQPPVASFTATPNPVLVGQSVAFNASASTDADGTITKYEWDLDGNGTYETNTGTTKTTSKTYATTGPVTVGLRVTDNGGKTATTTVTVSVSNSGASAYPDAIQDTPGLLSYWRLGDPAGSTTFADSKGGSTGGASAVTFGVPGGVAGDPNTAARFNGTSSNGHASLDLSGTSAVTVEFWLKWNAYAGDDSLAMEFTPNFNAANGGFLVDPNAPQSGGKFGVAIGDGSARNNVFFARPSAGAWHHYAFVIDTGAAPANQITPYVDGQPIAYTKLDSGTGAGNFANSTLYLMSRAGSSLFGAGDLDELAIYTKALTAAQIQDHFSSFGTNRRPSAAFTISKNPVKPNTSVTFNASGSSDPDGSIVRYQWDLDGNGSFETDTGTTATVSKSYAAQGAVPVSLRVIDNQGGTDVTTTTLVVGNSQPTSSFTATPNPAVVNQTVTFDGSASADPDGTVVKYEWDLDGNGSYETTTTVPTTTKSYAAAATINVGLRVTDNDGATGTTTRSVSIHGAAYSDAVLATPGLRDYWRLDETTGPTFADAKGASPATAVGGVTFGVPGAFSGANGAARFDGAIGFAQTPLDLSATSTVTIEFWLKWSAYVDNDALAMEFTPNFNGNPGGFLVDPNSSNGLFGVGIGSDASRNDVFFARPSAGVWHHYTFVIDTTAPAATEITPYVDGQPVSFSKLSNGTGAGAFASSTLYLMSRGGASLFGAGDLDEVAIYTQLLSAATIAAHYADAAS